VPFQNCQDTLANIAVNSPHLLYAGLLSWSFKSVMQLVGAP
jgi:hypothetical protein